MQELGETCIDYTEARKRNPIIITLRSATKDSILPFVKGSPHMVALCLVGLPIDPRIVEQQFIRNINPDRPAFWFYVGSELPEAKDHTIPRIHYEGIVNPNNPYDAPPSF